MKQEYLITYWDGIPFEFFNEDRIKEAVECGFTLIQGGKVGGYRDNAIRDEGYDVLASQKALEICEKLGVKYTVFDIRIVELVNGEASDEEIDSTVRAVCEAYRDYPALHSYLVKDEPDTTQFPRLKKIVDAFKRYDPAHMPYINLFPNYASPAQLGADDYETYVEQFIKVVQPELLCYDHYHLFKADPNVELNVAPGSFEAQVYAASMGRDEKSGFYNNLEAIRNSGLKNGIPYMLIVLLVEHGPYKNLTRSELYFEVWQTLAYGCSALSYYNYWELPRHTNYSNAIISADGERCEHYWVVQEINRRIAKIGECVASTRSEAVFHVGDSFLQEGVTLFTPYRNIEDISGGHLTVGFFEDDTFIIANQDCVSPADVTITTSEKLMLIDEDSCILVPLRGNRLTIPAGEGVYLKILS